MDRGHPIAAWKLYVLLLGGAAAFFALIVATSPDGVEASHRLTKIGVPIMLLALWGYRSIKNRGKPKS